MVNKLAQYHLMKELVNLKRNIKKLKITPKAVYIKKPNNEYPSTVVHGHFMGLRTKFTKTDQVVDYNYNKTILGVSKGTRN